MAENVEMIRPINLPEAQQLSENDVFILDSETGGVRKIPKNKVYTPVDDTLSESGEAADAKVTGEKIAEVKAETALIQNPVGNKSGELVSFSDGADMPAISVIAHIEPIQEGEGDPSPENVRPISGWESVNVDVSGVNIWNEEWEYRSGAIRNVTPIPLKPNTTYFLKAPTGTSWANVYCLDANGNDVKVANANATFTTTADTVSGRLVTGGAYGTTYNHDISINYPSTDHAYHAYNGHTTTTPLGRTVYGADAEIVGGSLTDKMAMVDLGTLNWQYNGSSPYKWFYTSSLASTIKPIETNADKANILSPIYEVTTRVAVGADESKDYAIWVDREKFVGVRDSRYTSAAAFKTAMSGVQLCYELATPQTYQLTPTEVKTLLGENNVWADSGDVEITYRRDINIVIDELTNAIVSLGSNV